MGKVARKSQRRRNGGAMEEANANVAPANVAPANVEALPANADPNANVDPNAPKPGFFERAKGALGNADAGLKNKQEELKNKITGSFNSKKEEIKANAKTGITNFLNSGGSHRHHRHHHHHKCKRSKCTRSKSKRSKTHKRSKSKRSKSKRSKSKRSKQ
jgi:hypothetical protein